jgi:pimeloyl-ACP methyl ester carboxylesterase
MPVDSGAEDSGVDDTGVRVDTGVVPDAGSDAGFADPNTLVQGLEDIVGTRTYVHIRGTETSTLPPIVMLPTGPHQGGVPGFFGHFGGGIGHEYWPPHMDFLLPSRMLIYFDFRATGRSGFGSIGSSTISVEAHMMQIDEVLDFVEGKLGTDTSEIDIVGHGYGAGVGALYAANNPDRVSRLVLIAPMAPFVEQYVDAIATLQSRLTTSDRQRLDQFTFSPECNADPSLCTLEIWRVLAPRLGCPGNESRVSTLMFQYGEIKTFDFIRRDLTEDQFDWRPLLPLIEAETTVVSGECDATAPEAALTYTASISGAAHQMIPNSGHWPMVEGNLEFQRAVSSALRYP